MRSRQFYAHLGLLVISCFGLTTLFLSGVAHTFNFWPVLLASMIYWVLHGAMVAHENNTDAIASVLLLRRCSNLVYWLIPVSVATGFL